MEVLYGYLQGNKDMNLLLDQAAARHAVTGSERGFVQELLVKTVNNLEVIDARIRSVLKNWDYERVAFVDKLILRLGVCELSYCRDIPFQVTINEAIELGKKFGSEDSGRFINGILDALVDPDDRAKEQHESRRHQ